MVKSGNIMFNNVRKWSIMVMMTPRRLESYVSCVSCHLHQLVNLRHCLGVLDSGGGLGPVQVLNVLDPLVNNLT